jgi:HTH-type transcriptional regulator / antitoxin HigA
MVQKYKEIIEVWPTVAGILSPPQNDNDLDKLIDFSNHLIDEIGENGNHPLLGLLDIVGTIIENYESENIPLQEKTPIECLKYLMEEHGLKQKDLTEIGSPGVISEILNGKRELNKRHIVALSKRFGCGAGVFL